MAEGFKLSNKCTISVSPFMEHGFLLNKIHMHESIGGAIASGEIYMQHSGKDTNWKDIEGPEKVEKVEIELKQEKGLQFKITGYIISVEKDVKNFNIKFSCIPNREFVENTLSLKHIGLDQAIDYSYSGDKDIRCEKDDSVRDDLEILQFQETSYEFCKRMATSYRYNTIFAFGLEGFLLKEIEGVNHKGNDEKTEANLEVVVSGLTNGQNVNQDNVYTRQRNFQFEKTPHDGWNENKDGDEYDDFKDDYRIDSKNLSAIVTHNQYHLVHRDFYNLYKNFEHNERFLKSSMFKNVEISTSNGLPDNFKLGDLVKYVKVQESSQSQKDSLYIVYENDFEITIEDKSDSSDKVRNFVVKSLLKCIQDENGEKLKW